MRIALAADHAGFTLKEAIAAFLRSDKHDLEDFGCFSLDSVDYPDFLYPAALAVARGECERGILVAGAGYAAGILANKVPGIRAAVCEDLWSVKTAREHGDANVLCLGGVTLGAGLAREIVRVFLETAALGGKYAKRNEKIRRIEEKHLATSAEMPREPSPVVRRAEALDLVTERDVERVWEQQEGLTVLRTAIITPAARDLIESRKIEIQFVD